MNTNPFSNQFNDKLERIYSYDYIEKFISNRVKNWDYPPDTDSITHDFTFELKQFSNIQLAFLMCHSGFIPEFYPHDSSQETLYSKLVESLVCEWAIRIGFIHSSLQKQKSSKEDITLKIDDIIIVCDAKSFRLGRSQAAPNVKDTIKKADYEKWLNSYPLDSRAGGLITFPSLFLWAKSSDVFSYISDGTTPIVLFTYEVMSYMLYKEITAQKLIELLKNYPSIHTSTTKNPSEYFTRNLKFLFNEDYSSWLDFQKLCQQILKERVNHTIANINSYLGLERKKIEKKIEKINVDNLRNMLIESEFHRKCNQIEKQLYNIKKFRPH